MLKVSVIDFTPYLRVFWLFYRCPAAVTRSVRKTRVGIYSGHFGKRTRIGLWLGESEFVEFEGNFCKMVRCTCPPDQVRLYGTTNKIHNN